MSNVPIADANAAARKIDTIQRTEGSDTVETQAVAVVDPTTGTPVNFATQSTLAAINTAIDTLNVATAAIKTAVEALDTSNISGNVGVTGSVEITNDTGSPVAVSLAGSATAANQTTGNNSLASIDGKLPALSGGRMPVELPAGGSGLTDSELRATPVPVSLAGVATQSTLAEINADLGAPADAAATTDTGTFSIIALFKRLFSRLPLLNTTIPKNDDAGVPVRPIGQDVWNCSFSNVGASIISPEFEQTPVVGTGVGYSQANGNLLITTGTSTNAEFLAKSIRSWEGSLRLRVATVLSQRIANNNMAVLLADLIGQGLAVTINSATSITVAQAGHSFTSQNIGQFLLVGGIVGAAGVPGRYAIASVVAGVSYNLTVAGWPASGSCTATIFGHSYVRNLFNGTTATNVAWDAQRRGWASGDTTATINTTASPGTVIVNELTGREAYLSDQLRASTTTPTLTTRASRVENLPDDNLELYVFLWSFNGTTAPASTTTWTISFCAIEKFANTPVYIQGARATGAVNPLPVQTQGTVPVSLATNTPIPAAGTALSNDVGVQYRASSTGGATPAKVIAAASTNATNIKASAGRLIGYQLQNTTASIVYVKMHNQATTPTAGASVLFPIPIPANGKAELTVDGGIAFGTGIGYTIVTGPADADATAVTAGAVVGTFHFA
jgi:hypothetical protein